jgi:hypothetical protein
MNPIRQIAIRTAPFAIAAFAPLAASAGEMCTAINAYSVIDRVFIANVQMSGTTYNMSKKDMICYADADDAKVAALRTKVYAANPQSCATFAKADDAVTARTELAKKSVPSWNETPLKLCYLAKDEEVASKVVTKDAPAKDAAPKK